LTFLIFIVCKTLPSSTCCNISSFFTRSVQLIASILLQHHISKLSRYFLCKIHYVSSSLTRVFIFGAFSHDFPTKITIICLDL
jgi:hypothetical protein